MKFYIDSDVWLNYWLDEMLGLIPAGYYAERLFQKALEEGIIIVLSDLVFEELQMHNINERDMKKKLELFYELCLIEEKEVTREDIDEAKKASKRKGIHLSDAVHTIIAKRAGAILVTRNIKHYRLVEDLVQVRKPEDLL